MRKLWFAYLARAFGAFPGGFGTLDEIFELLTLAQTGKLDRPVRILLYGSQYWRELVNFDALVKHGMISPEDLELFQFVDTPQAALAALQHGLSLQARPSTPSLACSITPNASRKGSS